MTRMALSRFGGAILALAAMATTSSGLTQTLQLAQNQPRAQQVQAPARLRPELLAVYDCQREIVLASAYWDRISALPAIRLERRFLDAALRAFQSGNVEECWRTVSELRRHMRL